MWLSQKYINNSKLNIITGAQRRLLIDSNDSNHKKSYGVPETTERATKTECQSSYSVQEKIFGTLSVARWTDIVDWETYPVLDDAEVTELIENFV